METDGSLKFDTKVDTAGFEKGNDSLLKAAERLTAAIESLSARMDHAFSSSGASAGTMARQVDGVTDAAKKARDELERLKKEKAETFSGTITNNNETPSSIPDDGKRYDIYGNDVDAIIAKNRELEAAARQASATVTAETRKEGDAVVGLKDSMNLAVESFKRFPGNIVALFGRAGAAMDGVRSKTRTFQDEIDRYQESLYYAEQKGLGLGDAEYDKAYRGIMLARAAAEKYKKSLIGMDSAQKKASTSTNRLGGNMQRASAKGAIPFTKAVIRLSSMLRLMVIRMAMRAAIKAAQEGFQNLARYSDDTNRSISLLMSANTKLKNSFSTAFAPVLHTAAPALKQMIDLLSAAATYAGQFIAALTGRSTFVKAVDVEEDYAASLKETNEELKEKEKETKKLAFAFDDLIQAQGGSDPGTYKPPTPDQMFETVEIEGKIVRFADTVKGILAGLFDPMRQSWDENGSAVIDAAGYALDRLNRLGSDVGRTFMTVWEREGYGKAVTDDVLVSVSNLLYTVGNLADGFDRAWESGDTGLLIMRHLGDLLIEVTGFFRDATGEIRIWSETLDFSPLLKSFDGVLVSLRPIVSKVGDILLWLLRDILLPLAKWGLENGVPAAFDLISAALKVLDSILNALKPLAIWLWDEFLQPLAKWTGDLFLKAIQKIVEWLTQLSDWISRHQTDVENITLAVLAFFAAWKFSEFVAGMAGLITRLGGFLGIGERVISLLVRTVSNINPLVLAVSGIISLIAILARNWGNMTPEEKVIAGILAAASAVGILAVALGALAGGVGAGVVAASLAAGIAAATIAINAGKRAASMGYSGGYGGRSTGPVSAYAMPVSSYRMPRLATGTVVPPRAGEFAAILGDNNRDTEIVSPVPAMKQAFKEAIEEMGGIGGNQTLKADLIVDGTKFGQLVYRFNNKEKQRVGVRMVTEG